MFQAKLRESRKPKKLAVAAFGLLVVMSVSGLVAAAAAQSVSTAIEGYTLDRSGAAVPNVTLVVVNETTGESTEATSDEAGRYQTPALTPGRYQIEAVREGFESTVRCGVTVAGGQVATLDVTLGNQALPRVFEEV